MKSAIILNVLATISLFSIGDACKTADMDTLHNLQSTVWTTVNDLSSYRDTLALDLASEYEEFKIYSSQLIQQIADGIISQFTNWVESLEEQDEVNVATKCAILAEKMIGQFVNAVEFDKCDEPARTFLNIVTNRTESTKQYGDSIMNELENIIVNCRSLEQTEFQNHIFPKISEQKESVEKLVNYAQNLKEFDGRITEKHSDCLQELVSNFTNKYTLINSAVAECYNATNINDSLSNDSLSLNDSSSLNVKLIA